MTRLVWTVPPPTRKNAHLIVVDALVPMLLWPSVPVIRRVEEALTILDRFVVETAVALAPMRTEDVEEVTGVPRDVVGRIAGRLTGLGLLRSDEGGYYAIDDAARAALGQRSVPEHHRAFLTFLFLPHSDDLIAFPSGQRTADPPLLQRATPAAMAPMPRRLAGVDRTEMLGARIRGRDIAGLPDDIVDAADPGVPAVITEVCPAFRCHGWVRGTGTDTTLVLGIRDGEGRNAVQVSLRGAVRQAAAWAAVSERAAAAASAWTGSGGQVKAEREGPLDWLYRLDGAAADAASTEVALSATAGLEIHAEDCVLAVTARFTPLDAAAGRTFALDYAIRAIAGLAVTKLDQATLTAAAGEGRAAYGVPDGELTDRDVVDGLWAAGHYWHVYHLRSERDFSYD